MKMYLGAAALIAAIAQPATAVTFPSLTTIYVGSGVYDDGGIDDSGEATSIHCSNVSGVSVQVRVLILSPIGTVSGALTTTLFHGRTVTFSTHATVIFLGDVDQDLATGAVTQGVVNVEATNSAVFCTAAVIDAGGDPPVFTMPIHLVRVNPHPGTVE
jgi:hypothetical protein